MHIIDHMNLYTIPCKPCLSLFLSSVALSRIKMKGANRSVESSTSLGVLELKFALNAARLVFELRARLVHKIGRARIHFRILPDHAGSAHHTHGIVAVRAAPRARGQAAASQCRRHARYSDAVGKDMAALAAALGKIENGNLNSNAIGGSVAVEGVQFRESARSGEVQKTQENRERRVKKTIFRERGKNTCEHVSKPVDLTNMVELAHARFESRRHLIEQHEKVWGHNIVVAVTELTTHLTGRIEKENNSPRLRVCERNIIWRMHSWKGIG